MSLQKQCMRSIFYITRSDAVAGMWGLWKNNRFPNPSDWQSLPGTGTDGTCLTAWDDGIREAVRSYSSYPVI